MTRLKPKRHIVWFHDREIDLSNPTQVKTYYEQVLTHGRAEDIAELDQATIRRFLPEMNLPYPVKRLWEDWFDARG